MKTSANSILRILLLTCIFCTLLFIFGQSILPSDESSEISGSVAGFFSLVFPPDTPFGAFFKAYVRKIAHFTEYFALGVFTSLYFVFFVPTADSLLQKRAPFFLLSLLTAPVVGGIDETIQIFSGRGPMIADVLLDCAGYLSAAAIVYSLFCIINYLKKNNKKQQI